MIERRLARQVGHIGRRLRWLGLLSKLSRVWLVAALVAVVALVAAAQSGPLPRWTAPALALAGLAIGLLVTWRTLARKIDPVETARHVEACYPELDAKLLAAVEQRPAGPAGQLGYLQMSVIGEALAHGQRDGWGLAAPFKRNVTVSAWHCLTLTLFGLTLLALVRHDHRPAKARHAGIAVPAASLSIEAVIEPGDTELERGKSLLVLARFPGELPAEVTLVHQSTGGPLERLPMSKSLDDPVFAGRVSAVQSDLTYYVEFASQLSPTYRVTVFDYPELERADIKLAFPAYTGQSETLVEDALQVTAVEGTRLTLIARLNKEVATAQLIGESQPAIELVADPNAKHAYVATLPLEKTVRYKLHLVDAAGRANKQPDNFTFTVLPNRRPEIKLVFPSRDLQVSPLEELELQATVWDDFGLAAYGIAYNLSGQPPREIVLGRQTGAKQRVDARELVSFEQFKAEPDQLLSYYFFAEDTGPDGQTRRTSSDMFFCEVRPFEEIFRQGAQPPGESSAKESGNPADKLVELQKQVVAATWKLVRRETGPQPSGDFAKDGPVLLEGEQEVLALADELEAKLHSPESRADLETARKHMRVAIEHLQQSVAGPALPPLTPALTAEQAAYQALLKLRAREHLIIHGNSKSKGSAAGQRSSEQLSQLELKNTENRYEERRTADKQADEAQRETRQVLSRLRELAQRQQDLNERIKEMQSSLQAAQTEQEKEEIRRQLKRLRDEEQQILRDADELRNRMDQPPNQQRMAEAREQLDQTRANVRRASEALQAGQTSQAAAAGTRAQQQLDQLRDQFRKQAAGRFNDEMRHMRDDARQLEKNEKELGEKLAELDKPKTKSLRDSSSREQVREDLDEQRTNLDKLVDSMRKTVDEAEQAEPLLAKQLYDTIRQTHQQRPAEALDSTRQLLERGFVDQARGTEQKAQAGIERLKQGVERAAETVLGDEAEAIRRARDEVSELARAIDDEMRRATGDPPSQEPAAQARDQRSPSPGAESKAGEPQGNGAPGGKSKDNEAKNGESKSSDAKSGESKSSDSKGQQGAGQQAPGGESKGGEPKPGESKPGSGQQGNSPSPASKSSQQGNQESGTPGGNSGKNGQPGDKPDAQGQPSDGQTPSGQASNGQTPGGKPSEGQSPAAQPGKSQKAGNQGQGRGGLRELLGTASGPGGPLTGSDFRPWADRLRDVEEMLDSPQLRAEAAKIRDRAAAMRAEFKRHSQEPNWDLVRETIYKPLAELRVRLAEELLKRQSNDALVPLDRDPVAPSYSEQVRRYYERLGSGQ